MFIIEEVLEKIGYKQEEDLLDVMRRAGDFLMDNNKKDPDIPRSQNILFMFEVPGILPSDQAFLCLEKTLNKEFLLSLWAKQRIEGGVFKRTVVWELDYNSPKKILQAYIEKYNTFCK